MEGEWPEKAKVAYEQLKTCTAAPDAPGAWNQALRTATQGEPRTLWWLVNMHATHQADFSDPVGLVLLRAARQSFREHTAAHIRTYFV